MSTIIRGRWYCSVHRDVQIFPGTIFEALTQAPEKGKGGRTVLLHTTNARLAKEAAENRVAWCFACHGFVRAWRRTMDDIYWLYAKRAGVTFAMQTRSQSSGTKTLLKILRKRRKRAA